VKPGQHHVKLRAPAGETLERDVEVEAGALVELPMVARALPVVPGNEVEKPKSRGWIAAVVIVTLVVAGTAVGLGVGLGAQPAQLDIPRLRSYLASLSEKNEPATVARKLSAVRAFLRFLRRERLIDENLAMLVRPPKAKKALPQFLTPDQAAALMEAPSAKK